jgi:hypothetical protein
LLRPSVAKVSPSMRGQGNASTIIPLTVIYKIQAMDDVVRIVEKRSSTGQTGLKRVGNSMLMGCQAQLTQAACDGARLDDSRIRREAHKQIDNVRSACDAIVAATN